MPGPTDRGRSAAPGPRGRKGAPSCRKRAAREHSSARRLGLHFGRRLCCAKLGEPVARHGGAPAELGPAPGARGRPAGVLASVSGPRGRPGGGGAMWPEGADERRAPEQPRDRPRSPARAALEREHVRAHLRARLKLLEVGILLDRLQSEVDSVEGAVGQGRCGSGEAEERVLKLYEKAERKAAEVARMGRRIVELHGQIDSCGFS
ncbi:putative MORF4 family-associated protein 1-like protein UPP [Prionailurus bengalensis]|uniref:putative MORF4 family-associated protein 1-like protein UPP n=1 Tax=Prionailurus bengalensis TaxID=37029 RepID=UPI001CA82815|nr:putative MORF4 family-associated protein 1-like protein UPP [Prionailurus bengalensis]